MTSQTIKFTIRPKSNKIRNYRWEKTEKRSSYGKSSRGTSESVKILEHSVYSSVDLISAINCNYITTDHYK